MVIVSAGWLFSKDVTAWLITVLAGLGLVVTSHMFTLVPPALPVEEALPLPAAEPHAASATVSAAAAVVTASHRGRPVSPDLRMLGIAFLLAPEGRIETFRKHFEDVRQLRERLAAGQPLVSDTLQNALI